MSLGFLFLLIGGGLFEPQNAILRRKADEVIAAGEDQVLCWGLISQLDGQIC